MKRLFFFFTALVAFGVVSCQKEIKTSDEIINPETGMQKVSITAISEGMTKTAYSDAGVFSWLEGDQISVRCSNGYYYTFTAESTGASSTFTGEIPAGTQIGDRAFYPADEHIAGEKGFYLATYKDMTSHPSAEIPMIGFKNGSAFAFQHMCGAFELVVDNIPNEYVAVEIKLVNDRRLLTTGLGDISYDGTANRYRTNTNESTSLDEAKRTFCRKVVVSNNKAIVYVPYSGGKTLNGTNTVTVTGFTESGDQEVLEAGRAMKNDIGYIEWATIKRSSSPLILSQLGKINWSEITGYEDNTQTYSSLKVTADDYYVYIYTKVKKSSVTWDTAANSTHGTYLYYGFDHVADAGTSYWNGTGKWDTIILAYPYGVNAINNAPSIKINGTTIGGIACTGTIGEGDDAFVESEFAVLRTQLGISKGTTATIGSYANFSPSINSGETSFTF